MVTYNSSPVTIIFAAAYFFHSTGIYVRLDHPDIFNFLQETLKKSEEDGGVIEFFAILHCSDTQHNGIQHNAILHNDTT